MTPHFLYTDERPFGLRVFATPRGSLVIQRNGTAVEIPDADFRPLAAAVTGLADRIAALRGEVLPTQNVGTGEGETGWDAEGSR